MDLNKLLQMAMQHSQELAKKHIEQQQTKEIIEVNRSLIMARTINRLVRPELIEAEFKQSLNELRDYYLRDIDDYEIVDSIHEVTGLAKNNAIDILRIADEMEID